MESMSFKKSSALMLLCLLAVSSLPDPAPLLFDLALVGLAAGLVHLDLVVDPAVGLAVGLFDPAVGPADLAFVVDLVVGLFDPAVGLAAGLALVVDPDLVVDPAVGLVDLALVADLVVGLAAGLVDLALVVGLFDPAVGLVHLDLVVDPAVVAGPVDLALVAGPVDPVVGLAADLAVGLVVAAASRALNCIWHLRPAN